MLRCLRCVEICIIRASSGAFSAIIDRHDREIKANYNISVNDKDMRLPKLFWIPKLHKNPYKFRFIAGARSSTTKKLSVNINGGLKVIRENFYRYCEAVRRNTGFSHFWSVASTQEFLRNISNVNVHSLQVFDFSTLYTNLDQNSIKHNVFSILDLNLVRQSVEERLVPEGGHDVLLGSCSGLDRT